MEEKRHRIEIERFAEKQLKKVPKYIREALYIWATEIETKGLSSMRKLPGYHDEPLKGGRRGQRSSRLSRSYRVIYEERESGLCIIVAVLEVNKHEY